MYSHRILAVFFLPLILTTVLVAQPKNGHQSAWESLVQQDPTIVDDSQIGWKERLILYALTPAQARDYYRGADPDTIRLESGDTLQQFLDKRMTPVGNLYFPLPAPCDLFSRVEVSTREPLVLRARGEDLSEQGGSPTGCGIPEEATALMVQVKAKFPSGLPIRVKLWAIDHPEPAESLVDSDLGHSDSTMAVVPLNRSDRLGKGEFQMSCTDWTLLEGLVVGYFRQPSAGDIPGGGVSFFSESTASITNDFFGYKAGGNTSSAAQYNVFFGSWAGYGSTPNTPNSGESNAFFGRGAGQYNTEGSANVYSGYQAGYNNTTGSYNVFTGFKAGHTNTTGHSNVFTGTSAGYKNIGSHNVFTGKEAGYNNTSGSGNVFIGSNAGKSNDTGINNNFSGTRAGIGNSTGSNNNFSGASAGESNWNGSFNVFVGSHAGISNVFGDSNTAIGYLANLSSGSTSDPVNNATAVGALAFVSQSNSLVLGSIDGVNGASSSVNVGIGTTAPGAPLHVSRSDSTARIILAESTGPESVRNMMDLKNNGMAQFRLIDTSPNGDAWQFSNTDNNLNISLQGSGSQEFLIENDGDVWINNGTVMVTSYRASKENFQDLDTGEILQRLASLPVSDWNYKKDTDTVRHIGPVSEDFYEAFGYGEDDQHISPNDLAGVNTAAIQGLFQKLLEKDQEIQDLRSKVSEIESLRRDLADLRELFKNGRNKKLTDGY
jgi:hypothetical protein